MSKLNEHIIENIIDKETLKRYIIGRIEALKNKNDYYYGFTCRADIVGGLAELRRLAKRMQIEVSPIHTFDEPNWLK